jgi:hypothetical protein
MKPYHKIESLFTRDMEGTKKLIEGEYRNSLVKYLKDNKWVFTEKIDGTNIRIHWDGHNVVFGGRTDNAQMPTFLLNDTLNPKFAGTVNEQIFEQKFGETPVTLYGEGFGAKIQNGGGLYRPDGTDFILFDVAVGDVFLAREDVEEIAHIFDVPVVPIILEGTIEDAVDYVKTKPKSLVAREEREIEGVIGVPAVRVLNHMSNRIIVKIKCEDFVA